MTIHLDDSRDNQEGAGKPEGGADGLAKTAPFRLLRPFVLLLLFLALYLSYLTLQSFLQPIIFAAVLASICTPFQVKLERAFRGRRTLAALCVVLIAALVIEVPLIVFLSALAAEGVKSVNRLQEWVSAGGVASLLAQPRVHELVEWLQKQLALAPNLDIQEQLMGFLKKAGESLWKQGTGLVANLANLVSQFLVMLFVMFYLVRDGRDMMCALGDLSPLPEDQGARIVERIRGVAKSVLLGSFLTAICQGIVGGLGLALVGIPAFFWGAVMGFASLVPMVGTALVWVPAAGYLAIAGRWKAAVFLVLWSALLVGSVDNFLRPFLMRGSGGLSPFYVFLAVMGGLQYFGLPGLLYGPLALAFTAVMLYIYKEEFLPTARE